MRAEVENDLNIAINDFNIAADRLSLLLGGGKFIQVEAKMRDSVSEILDTRAGIDVLQVFDDGTCRGIACRFQTIKDGFKPYNTFTIRHTRTSGHETEYIKRVKALDTHLGLMGPTITVHGYLSKSTRELLSVGCVRTAPLIRRAQYLMAYSELRKSHTQTNSIDDNLFIVIAWDELVKNGIHVDSWEKKEGVAM